MTELARSSTVSPPGARVSGELVDVDSLAARAAAVAADQGAPLTRQTYASVYRAFTAFLGPDADADAFTSERVRAYRDELERAGRSPATIAKHLSALRTLAAALGTDGVRNVRGAKVARGEPRALTATQYARLLRTPDLRTTAGKRDVALLHLLGTAGLRRAEASALRIGDVDEHPRADDPRLRRAIAHSTPWWVTVHYGKRGRSRRVPLEQGALDALTAWVRVRPTCAHDELLVSLPRNGQPSRPLTVRDITRIVTRYATLAELPTDRRSPHVLRHTFCTHLADSGTAIDVIRNLAGHADIRTTTIYTAVHDDRLEDAIEHAERQRRGLAKLAGSVRSAA